MSKRFIRKDLDPDSAIEEIMEAYESSGGVQDPMSMLSDIYRKYRDSEINTQIVGIEREPFTDKAIEDPATMDWFNDYWAWRSYDIDSYTLYDSGGFTGIIRGIIDAPEYIAEELIGGGYDEADKTAKDLYDRFIVIAGKYGVNIEKSVKTPTFSEMYSKIRKKYH